MVQRLCMTTKTKLSSILPKIKISGLGTYLPRKKVSNKDLEKIMDTTEDFIVEKTGVLERRFVKKNETNAMLMEHAIRGASQKSKVPLEKIDALIVNTLSPDFHDPSQACLVQGIIKELIGIPAFDIRAQCAGFLYGAYLARSLIVSGAANHVLVVCGRTAAYGNFGFTWRSSLLKRCICSHTAPEKPWFQRSVVAHGPG